MHLALKGENGASDDKCTIVSRAALEQERAAADNASSHEQNCVLNELIIALMRKNVLSDLEGRVVRCRSFCGDADGRQDGV
jgi:hypothetical protein